MTGRSSRLAIVLVIFLGAFGRQACGADRIPKNLPFGPGEELRYKLVWNRIPVGYFSVGIKPMTEVDGKRTWHFYLVIQTNGFADRIYKVRQFTDSYVSPDLKATVKYHSNQRQGKTMKVIDLLFDWEKMSVNYKEKIANETSNSEVPQKCVDPLAMFYAIRMLDFDVPDKKLAVWVSDGKKHVNCKTSVVKKETIKVRGKRYKTYKLEPDLKDLHGVFKKSKDAKLIIWVSDDKYKIPVKLQSKVLVGKFYAQLIEFKKAPAM